MKRLSAYTADFLILAGFLLLPLLLYGSVTLGGRTMLPADNLFQWAPWSAAAAALGAEVPQNHLITDLIIQNYPWKRFVLTSLQSGEIPLWNPNLFAGAPFLAAGQHSAYYPLGLLFLIMPLAKAYGWFALSQLWLAGALMYVFGRILHMRRGSAALAGLVYQGAGFMVISTAVFPMIIAAAVWLPLLLGCIEKIVQDVRFKIVWLTIGAVALGIQIFAGHVEITYYTLLLMALYAAWRMAYAVFRKPYAVGRERDGEPTEHGPRNTEHGLRHTLLKPAIWLSGMVLIGLLLGAVQLVPLFEVGQMNFREGSASFAEVRSWAFPARRILTLALPNFFGNPAYHSYQDVFSGEQVAYTADYYGNPRAHNEWGFKNYVEGAIYLGILPLFLMILGFRISDFGFRNTDHGLRFRERKSQTIFFAGISFFSLAFIFGTPLYGLLYYGLPFINQLHTPFRWIFPLTLCVAALAGFGADHLAATRRWSGWEDWRASRQPAGAVETAVLLFTSDVSVARWKRPFFLWGTPGLITALAAGAFWGGLLLLGGLWASKLFYPQIEPFVEHIFLGLALAANGFDSARAFYSFEYRQFFTLGLMLIASGTVLRVSRCPIYVPVPGVGKRPLWELLAAIIIVLDLFLANWGFHAAVDPALLDYKPQMVQWLEQQPGLWRITSFNPSGDIPFNANSGWLYDFQDIRGYDSIIPKQYTEFMAAIEPQGALPYNRIQPIATWEALNSPLLSVLGVKYVITSEQIDLPQFVLAWEGEGVRVYENTAVAPRAYTLPLSSLLLADDALAALRTYDPRQFAVVETGDWRLEIGDLQSEIRNPKSEIYTPATIDAYGINEVTVTAVTATPTILILNDSYFPGWKAFVRPAGTGEDQEQQVDIFRVNGNFRGVVLPEAGQWTVRYKYSPTSFQLGGLGSFMGVILLLFVGLVWGWRIMVKPDAQMTTTRSLAKNSMAPMALNLFNKGIDFVYAMFYLRVLGPANAGSFATAIAAAGIFEIVANFGLDILLVREVSQDRQRASSYLLNTSILRVLAAFVAAAPVAALVLGANLFSNPFTPAEIAAIIFIMLGMLFSGMSKGVTGLFYVYEKAEIPAAMTTLTTILRVGLGVAVLLLGFGFVGLAAVSIAINIVTLTILAILARRNFALPGPWRVDWGLQRRMVRLGWPLMLIHLLQTIFISIDVYLLRVMLDNGDEVVGWYNSAYKWFNALQIVPSFFTLALFPIISREIQRSLDAARRMYSLSLKLMLLLALPIAASITFLAELLVRIVGGAEFLPHGAIALQIVIWAIPIGWLNSVTNYVLIALGLERMQPRAFSAAVAFNVITNFLFIPYFTYQAAGVTTILSEVVLMGVFAYYLRQRMPGVDWVGLLAKPLGLTAVVVIVMALGSRLHPVVGVVLGLVVYAVGLPLLRIVGEDERQVLRAILPASIARRLRLV
ncbi:MAG: oligosaccharide flippase family protein [Chloroflexi bacterium]|nr:oligosaccharide flippase family protein [Chloroflexota bacterium]